VKIAIYGYGNLGRGAELAIRSSEDMELFGVFSRRDPSTVKTLTGATVYPAADVFKYEQDIDALIICGGSATDLPVMTPMLAEHFNVVDSFDTHARIPEHMENVDKAARKAGKTAVISVGWDPGMFSIMRGYAQAILPNNVSYTFWGRGVSQGHSDAIRRIPGVIDARQYTVPVEEALSAVRSGKCPELTTRQKHTRECFVVAEDGADKAEIERQIVTMPNYFADYDTTVTFISAEEMKANHSGMPHGGAVISTGTTGLNNEHSHTIEYNLDLDSNPEFTARVLTAMARAAVKMNSRGQVGCMTAFDITISDMSGLSREELIKMI